jgi:hypothetical protein
LRGQYLDGRYPIKTASIAIATAMIYIKRAALG